MKKHKIALSVLAAPVVILGVMLAINMITAGDADAHSEYGDGGCSNILATPPVTGYGANCAAATANFNANVLWEINMICEDGICGTPRIDITIPCRTVGGQKAVTGYGYFRCWLF